MFLFTNEKTDAVFERVEDASHVKTNKFNTELIKRIFPESKSYYEIMTSASETNFFWHSLLMFWKIFIFLGFSVVLLLWATMLFSSSGSYI